MNKKMEITKIVLLVCILIIFLGLQKYNTEIIAQEIKQADNSAVKKDDKNKIEKLKEALKDKDINVRVIAIRALGQIRNKEAVPSLIEALKDKKVRIRFAAIEALGHIGNIEAATALIEILKDTDKDICLSATSALENIGNKEVTLSIVNELGAKDEIIRNRAKKSLETLNEISKSDKSSEVVKWAQEIIKLIDASIK